MVTYKIVIPQLQEEDEEKISKSLHDVWGIRNVEINTSLKEVIVSFNEKAGSIQDFRQAIEDLGYEAIVFYDE